MNRLQFEFTIFGLFGVIEFILGFNLDVINTRLVHQHARETWFGYSVDIHKDDTDQMWLLVGAPKYQTTQPDVRNGGAVFRCHTTRSECQEITFDDKAPHSKGLDIRDNRALNGSYSVPIDSKSNQLFGATVVASRSGDGVLACAPSYKAYPNTGPRRLEPVGSCYLARNDFQDVQRYSPCNLDREYWWGFHRTGYCMVGFSAAMSSEEDKLFFGAPGAWYWQGSLFVQNSDTPGDVRKTGEGPASNDDTYMGYAMSSGDYNGDGITDVAIGTPKGNNLTGMVALFEHDLTNIMNLTGEQKGSYFGSAIATVDLDGDGLVDLIVGAPLFSDHKDEKGVIKSAYEVGKVYVYFQGKNKRFEKHSGILGSGEWSRFGFSLAGAGDLNGDGFDDFIVGAPYDGPNRRGAVYVYHGMSQGVREKFSQVIFSEEVDTGLTTFGFSLGGGRDVDRNTYPDIVVGAYKSSKVVLFKTRPVVSVTGFIKLRPPIIDLKDKACPSPAADGTFYPCTQVQLCLEYTGRGSPSNLDLNVLVILDAEKDLSGRAFTLATGLAQMRYGMQLRKGIESCQLETVYVLDTIKDKLNPIIIQANFTLEETRKGIGELRPVLDANKPESIIGKLEILKDCGPDKVCIPDLQLKAAVEKEVVIIGAGQTVNIDVSVSNKGEDAYEAMFYLLIPAGVEFVEYKKISELAATCSTPEDFQFRDRSLPTRLECEIGNPLEQGKEIKLRFELSAQNLGSSVSGLTFEMAVNSTNEEREATLDDNYAEVKVSVEVEANIVLTGVSVPSQVNYEMDDRRTEKMIFDEHIGPLVTHLYEVRNRGPSGFKAAMLNIYWPSYTQAGQHLLYLVGDPQVVGNAECRIEQQGNVNPDSVLLTSRDNRTVPTNLYALKLKRLRRAAEEKTEEEVDRSFVGQSGKLVKTGFRKLVNKIRDYGSSSLYSGELNKVTVNCTSMKCTQIRCDLGEMEVGEAALVYVDSRLYVNTLIDEAFYDASISSVGIAKVTQLPFDLKEELPPQTAIVTTFVNPKDPALIRRGVPWWVIFIAILAGVTILVLLILLLWRTGFFKRTRPPKSQAMLTKPPESEYYGYTGYSSGYAPSSMYSESQHGPRL